MKRKFTSNDSKNTVDKWKTNELNRIGSKFNLHSIEYTRTRLAVDDSLNGFNFNLIELHSMIDLPL